MFLPSILMLNILEGPPTSGIGHPAGDCQDEGVLHFQLHARLRHASRGKEAPSLNFAAHAETHECMRAGIRDCSPFDLSMTRALEELEMTMYSSVEGALAAAGLKPVDVSAAPVQAPQPIITCGST